MPDQVPEDQAREFAAAFRGFLDWVHSVAARDVNEVSALVRGLLGPDGVHQSVVTRELAPFEHVNVQTALDAWSARAGRVVEVRGIALLLPGRTCVRHEFRGICHSAGLPNFHLEQSAGRTFRTALAPWSWRAILPDDPRDTLVTFLATLPALAGLAGRADRSARTFGTNDGDAIAPGRPALTHPAGLTIATRDAGNAALAALASQTRKSALACRPRDAGDARLALVSAQSARPFVTGRPDDADAVAPGRPSKSTLADGALRSGRPDLALRSA